MNEAMTTSSSDGGRHNNNSSIQILNARNEGSAVQPMAPTELARSLQKAMLCVKSDYISEDGKHVDYNNLASSTAFKDYVELSRQLVDCDPAPLSEEERTAFFINIYNCLTLHGLATADNLPSSVLEISQFWKVTAYSINHSNFSLDDIEHGILRGNRAHPSSATVPFSDSDPRKLLALKRCDPRIHFALVCGAKSCPAIQVYSSHNLEQGLAQAAASFCLQEVVVDVLARKVTLSKIFIWYGSDFGSNERQILQCLVTLTTGQVREQLHQMLESAEPIQVNYSDYNWHLNKL